MFKGENIFNCSSKSSSKMNNSEKGSVESDALPVCANAKQPFQKIPSREKNNNTVDMADISPPVDCSMNLNNVNQQVVIQFSHISGLQIGSTYNIGKSNFDEKEKSRKLANKRKLKCPKTISIEAMMTSQEEPNREFLNEIATHLGSDFKTFMRELGFSEGQISAKNVDHYVYGLREVIYQLLLDWVRNAEADRTVGYLTSKLWNSGHHECVYRLKCLWKSQTYIKKSL